MGPAVAYVAELDPAGRVCAATADLELRCDDRGSTVAHPHNAPRMSRRVCRSGALNNIVDVLSTVRSLTWLLH